MQTSQKSQKPTTIGLVGGIASGKSYVANALAELGAAVIDADKIGHDILKQPLIVRRLAQVFGSKILAGDTIDRQALANLVFGEDEASEKHMDLLQDILHPLIHAEAIRRLRSYAESDTPPLAVVIDAPLLLEAKWEPMCDLILFVDTPREIRLQRATERGWTDQHFDAREAKQMSLNEKRAAATHIIPAGDAETLRSSLRQLWQQICATHP